MGLISSSLGSVVRVSPVYSPRDLMGLEPRPLIVLAETSAEFGTWCYKNFQEIAFSSKNSCKFGKPWFVSGDLEVGPVRGS